jgi:hypothetical protein
LTSAPASKGTGFQCGSGFFCPIDNDRYTVQMDTNLGDNYTKSAITGPVQFKGCINNVALIVLDWKGVKLTDVAD